MRGGRSPNIQFGDEVALNPQPLPPRFAFLVSLAQTVISRAELFQEIADATRYDSEQRDKVNAAVINDPRLAEMMKPGSQPFDCKRMVYGGFKTLVEI